jgi:hypothetical protein
MADFNHVDYTAELNRIIVALTGIRDDVRLLRRRSEDSEQGVVVSQVMNDFQRALLAVSMSASGGNSAEAVRQNIESGASLNGGIGTPAADSGSDAGDSKTERETILGQLGQDIASTKVLIRVSGLYYWEADPVAGVDDGLRGPIPVVTQYALGAQLGYHDLASNIAKTGTPPEGALDVTAAKKRWAAPRAEGETALQIASPDADLVNPATGEVIGVSTEAQAAAIASAATPTAASSTAV